jgi:hypothetical protein
MYLVSDMCQWLFLLPSVCVEWMEYGNCCFTITFYNYLEKLVKKFTVFLWDKRLVILITRSRRWTLSWATWIQFTSCFSEIHFNIIVPCTVYAKNWKIPRPDLYSFKISVNCIMTAKSLCMCLASAASWHSKLPSRMSVCITLQLSRVPFFVVFLSSTRWISARLVPTYATFPRPLKWQT